MVETHNSRLAHMLARHGFAVFPCGPDKKPLCKWRDASTVDPQAVETLWRANPDAPPGIDCAKSSLAVVDVDCHEGGENGRVKFAALEALHGRIDDVPRITTPSGGYHLYFRQPTNGDPVTNSRGLLPTGCDVRGVGGYVLAAGAMLPDGRKYAPEPGSPRLSDVLEKGGLKPLEGWLLDLIRPAPKPQERSKQSRRDNNQGNGDAYARAALARECDAVAGAAQGGRNETLNKAAFSLGQLVGGGELQEQEVVDALLAAARQAGLPRVEAMKTIHSGLAKGKESPRQRPVNERSANIPRHADHARDHGIARQSFPVPRRNDERGPVMKLLDNVLMTDERLPPMRDLDGAPVAIVMREPAGLHELSAEGVNDSEDESSRLPAPPQHMIVQHDRCSLTLMIENYVEFYRESTKKDDPDAQTQRIPVALPSVFVDFYLKHRASRLPRVAAVMTLPIVTPKGELLATNGLDRKRKVAMCIDPALVSLMPQPPIQQAEVREALAFLIDQWLVDVAADYAGKCAMVALALSCLERLVLPERPAFFVVSGRRGGGKTTALNMISLALTGSRAAASAWAADPEERRKALLPILRQNLVLIIWDNIRRGALISCPNLEKVLTGETYEDRVLGESRTERASAATILTFTGNNIAPRGDMASRSLIIRLEVDRPDPENREFAHPDSFEWTLQNRGKILSALYTILLGNPHLLRKETVQFNGRFKVWQRIVGAAVEHAAELAGQSVDFSKMFLSAEADDDENTGNVIILKALDALSPDGAPFRSADVLAYLKEAEGSENAQAIRSFIDSRLQGLPHSKTISAKLKTILDAPLWVDGGVWILRSRKRSDTGVDFWIEKKAATNDEEVML